MPGLSISLEPSQAYAEWNSGFTVLFQTAVFRRRAALHGPLNSTDHMICYSLYFLFLLFLFPGSSPFATLNPSQINYFNYFFFPLVLALLYPYPDLIFLILLSGWPWRCTALLTWLPWCSWPWVIALPEGLQHPLQGHERLSPFPHNSSCTLMRSARPSQSCL